MKVLVVIDMQKDFTTGVLGNEQTAAVVAPVAEKIPKILYLLHLILILKTIWILRREKISLFRIA